MLNAIPGVSCVAPRAAFYALPSVTLPPGKTDEDYVLSLLRETGILCVHGSGFGMRPEDGFLRIVFLAESARPGRDLFGHGRVYARLSAPRLIVALTTRARSFDTRSSVSRFTAMLLWAAYLVRGALLLIYISALVAVGLSPVVTRLERRRIRGNKPLPRWVAILEVYLLLVVVIVILGDARACRR